MKGKYLPQPLTAAQATQLSEEVELAIAAVRLRFVRDIRPDLDNYAGDNEEGDAVLYREIALALGRACVRYGFDILPDAAASAIDRLEIAIAEQNAKLEQFKIASIAPASTNGHACDHPLNRQISVYGGIRCDACGELI